MAVAARQPLEAAVDHAGPQIRAPVRIHAVEQVRLDGCAAGRTVDRLGFEHGHRRRSFTGSAARPPRDGLASASSNGRRRTGLPSTRPERGTGSP